MAIIRYVNDIVDIYDTKEIEIIKEIRSPIFFGCFNDIFELVSKYGQPISFNNACKLTLLYSYRQKKSTGLRYLLFRAKEGGSTGLILYSCITPRNQQSHKIRAFYRMLGISSNLWDTFFDLKEDEKMSIAILFVCPLMIIYYSFMTIWYCPRKVYSFLILTKFILKFYLRDDAKKKWSNISRTKKWKTRSKNFESNVFNAYMEFVDGKY